MITHIEVVKEQNSTVFSYDFKNYILEVKTWLNIWQYISEYFNSLITPVRYDNNITNNNIKIMEYLHELVVWLEKNCFEKWERLTKVT